MSVSIPVGSSRGIMITSGKCLCSGHTVNSNRQHESHLSSSGPWRGGGSFRGLSLSDWQPEPVVITGSGLSNESTDGDEHKASFLCLRLFVSLSFFVALRVLALCPLSLIHMLSRASG